MARMPGHLDSVRTKLRPKHQLLILKCFPRLPKNQTAASPDIKPNGSELSYLLYYASTRSIKLEKVGTFLERKAAADLSKSQSALVQVTLQVIAAIVEKVHNNAGAFALIAPYGLRIIRHVVSQPSDAALVEATVPTWRVFCERQDYALQAADHEYRELFEHVAEQYAALASRDTDNKTANIRLRQAGLDALKGLLHANEGGALDSSPQLLDVATPAILSNLAVDDASHLDRIAAKSQDSKHEERTPTKDESQSGGATTAAPESDTADDSGEAASAEEAARLEEEAVSVSALKTLEGVFASGNKTHLRAATTAVLAYACSLKRTAPQVYQTQDKAPRAGPWATKIVHMIVSWTPMQDRFVDLVAAVELLARLRPSDADLPHSLLLASLIDDVLRSDLNLIGLSVMDVLLSLIQKQVHVLQPESGDSASRDGGSASRAQLVQKLKSAVVNLATHVYYSDQITDMTSAILSRLRPDSLAPTPANGDAKPAVSTVNSNGEGGAPGTSRRRFSLAVSRKIALETVKDIITVANSERNAGSTVNRNRVPMTVWEGTQWLLRDSAFEVRVAYASALTAWLTHETTKRDFRLNDDRNRAARLSENDGSIRRAVTNASVRGKPQGRDESPFLSLLHVAHYESALAYAAKSDADVSLLHLLLSNLVQRCGVNAVQHGLPMIFTLQSEVRELDADGQIRLGSLVHGYLLSVVDTFGLQSRPVGVEVLDEVSKRKSGQLWTDNIPVSLSAEFPVANAGTKEATPFSKRADLVDGIVEQYNAMASNAGASPPASPSRRNFSLPSYVQDVSNGAGEQGENGLLQEPGTSLETAKLKSTLMATWNKDECLAQAARAEQKAMSINGSRSSVLGGSYRQMVAGANSILSGRNNSVRKSSQAFARGTIPDVMVSAGDGEQENARKASVGIDELRKVLSEGQASGRKTVTADTDSDSMVEVAEVDEEEFMTPPTSKEAIDPFSSTAGLMPSTEQATRAMQGESGDAKRQARKRQTVSVLLGKIALGEDEKPAFSIASPPY